MSKYAKSAILAVVIAYVGGCGPGKGERLADKVNDIVVAKIQKGEIQDEFGLAMAQLDATFEAMKALGIKADDSITASDQKKMDEKLKKYEIEWKKMVADKAKEREAAKAKQAPKEKNPEKEDE